MSKPTDLGRARRDRLATDLAERLQASPGRIVRADVDDDGRVDGVTVDEWRAAGRHAGRRLGWKVVTYAGDGFVVLTDNRPRSELTDAERNRDDLRERSAAEHVASIILGPHDPPKPN